MGRGHGIGWCRRWRLGMRCFVFTQGTMGLGRQAGKGLGLSGAWAAWGRGDVRRLATGDRIMGPEPIKQEEQPYQSDQHKFVEKQWRYHRHAPSDGGEMRAFYPIFALIELSAGLGYTTAP